MDATTKAIIEIISDAGYAVMTCADSDGKNGVEATDKTTRPGLPQT